MPVYDAKSISGEVNSSDKDLEVAAFLRTGPVLGVHKPIHEQRVEHDPLMDKFKHTSRAVTNLEALAV
jgi:hypothetical protein